MVYLHFPSNKTEEELMLQAKYAKLKKKKKAVQALKSPRPEPERTPQAPKRPAEARDAREVAKKLLKSGAITAIPKAPQRPEQAGFKRPRNLKRKFPGTEKTVSGYQPFSATHPEDLEADNRPKVKNLYESFVTARDREERGRPDKPRQGNTIFVAGHKITEDYLRKEFQRYGNIVNVTMEIEKNRGFVTFDKMEAAADAISETDGSIVSGIQLKVSLARRQPVIQPINDASSSSAWSTIAASHSQKGSHKDKREIVTYDDDDIFG
ncbi:negative elongation factor E [Schistocerca gregaria]|uniref:negative elongation factor E n=1 Tax=Schistocerca gregaria TaxID=7010 RepID=UPI00211F39A0|nr:negative elongation factor E [Schistocerca gregaria]